MLQIIKAHFRIKSYWNCTLNRMMMMMMMILIVIMMITVQGRR